jgi:hypothetical protein
MAAVNPRQIEQLLAAERMRISAIIESEAGKLRPMLALELALRSPMSVDAATALLAKAAPEARHASAADSFQAALKGEAIGLTSLGAEVATDKREARLKEIKRNVGKGKRDAE